MANFLNVIHSNLAEDPDFSDLVQAFVGEIPEKIARIQRFVEERDMASLRRTVHQLRGACGGYGFPSLSEAAGLLEERITKADFVEIQDHHLNGFLEMLARVTAEVDPNSASKV